jgi:hypothetical protein
MALTRAWMPGACAVAAVSVGVAAEALVVAVAVVEVLATAAPTLVTLAAPPKMLAGDTVLVARPDAAVPALNFWNRLANGLVDAMGPVGCAGGFVGPEAAADELGGRLIGAVRFGSKDSAVCVTILIRPSESHFACRSKALKTRPPGGQHAANIRRDGNFLARRRNQIRFRE